MGAALTYARRYALFTLVGIAGEDDLDAPDLNASSGHGGALNLNDDPTRSSNPETVSSGSGTLCRPNRNGGEARQPTLAPATSAPLRDQLSAVLRDQLMAELAGIHGPDQVAVWARKTLPAKNTLTKADARLVEDAFARRLASFETLQAPPPAPQPLAGAASTATAAEMIAANAKTVTAQTLAVAPGGPHVGALDTSADPDGIDKGELVMGEPRRRRDKVHLKFVAREPCLVCGRKPCDPHHLRFAQKRALGRKVSDEFCVPLCRTHHRELHRAGNEALWWENRVLDPLRIARKLWQHTRQERAARHKQPEISSEAPRPKTQPTAEPGQSPSEAAASSAAVVSERS
jgi:hypothetical protein